MSEDARELALFAPSPTTTPTTTTTALATTKRERTTIATPPRPLSPTSPKATKFCCCPNRRRYNLAKQSKKAATATLNARNILSGSYNSTHTSTNSGGGDDEFTYIDDADVVDAVDNEHAHAGTQQQRSPYQSQATAVRTSNKQHGKGAGLRRSRPVHVGGVAAATADIASAVCLLRSRSRPNDRENHAEDDDDDDDDDEFSSNSTGNLDEINQQPWRSDSRNIIERPTTTTTNDRFNEYNKSNNNQTKYSAVTNDDENEYDDHVTDDDSRERVAAQILKHQQQLKNYRSHDTTTNEQQQQQQAQRFSNSECNHNRNRNHNRSNKQTKSTLSDQQHFSSSSSSNNNEDGQTYIGRNCCQMSAVNGDDGDSQRCNTSDNKKSNNIFVAATLLATQQQQHQPQQQQQQEKKMTITTTTNVAQRKRSECGLTLTSTTTTTATSATPTMSGANMSATTRPTATTTTTPSLTTVIKTVAVKRTPLNEATSSPATATTPATPPQTPNATTPTPTTPTATATTTSLLMSANMANHKGIWENSLSSRHQHQQQQQQHSMSMSNGNANNTNSNTNNNNNSNNNSSKCDESNAVMPTRTVKERIAALVAGNEQASSKHHDKSIKFKSPQCNRSDTTNNQSNMTTPKTAATLATTSLTSPTTPTTPTPIAAKSAINSLHHNQNAISNQSNKSSSSSSSQSSPQQPQQQRQAMVATNQSAATLSVAQMEQQTTKLPHAVTVAECSSEADVVAAAAAAILTRPHSHHHKSGLSDTPQCTATAATSAVAPLLSNTGCATVPRRRSLALAANERNASNELTASKGGLGGGGGGEIAAGISNTTTANNTNAMTTATTTPTTSTAIEHFSNGRCDKTAGGGINDTSRNLAALDNLDLALNLNLTDDDGEDPYFALQEYLEKVKLEINEVFELHKARQKLQQMQQQQQQQQHQQQPQKSHNSSHAGTTALVTTATGATRKTAAADMQHVAPTTTTTTTPPLPLPLALATANDELSRSTESDSGFDSATGGGRSNKLLLPPKAPTATATAAQSTTATNCQSDDTAQHLNGHIGAEAAKAELFLALKKKSSPSTITKLKALSPPPVTPPNSAEAAAVAGDVSERRQQFGAEGGGRGSDDVNIWANKFLRDLDNLMTSGERHNKFAAPPALSASACSSPTSSTAPWTLPALPCRYGKSASPPANAAAGGEQQAALILRPEKHTTIPLQSFNLDCARLDNDNGEGQLPAEATPPSVPTARSSIAYMRTLSAPTAATSYQYQHHDHQQQPLQALNDGKFASTCGGKVQRNSLAAFNAITNTSIAAAPPTTAATALEKSNSAMTILKIEETAAAAAAASAAAQVAAAVPNGCCLAETAAATALKGKQRAAAAAAQTIESAAVRCNGDKSMLVASTIPKRERINHATTATGCPASLTPPPTVKRNGIMSTSSSATANGGGGGGGGGSGVGAAATSATGYMLNGSDATKKGSTSTIWTSEESILRSVGAVDEDNNSTSSSACEEASGVLSSGKSGISLDSSGLDNDNNESGIGTATPPKDVYYWKNMHNDNESVSSLDALRKMKFQKSGSVASSDDPDLLEVLSLYDEPHHNGGSGGGGDEDIGEDELQHDDIDEHQQRKQQHLKQQQQRPTCHRHNNNNSSSSNTVRHNDNNGATMMATAATELDDDIMPADEDDEGHDDFDTTPYCDCDCATDGDVSSTSGSGISGGAVTHRSSGLTLASNVTGGGVVLRRKCVATPIMVPYNGGSAGGGRAAKCRSHSLDTSPQQHLLHYHHHSPLSRKLHHLHPQSHHRTKERGQLSLALRQEPFQSLLTPAHFPELPSPSSASLHSGHESLCLQELTTKSNSAPLLLKQERKRDDFAGQQLTLRYSRSQSDRYLAEIEAVEACKWLRAAGFPQYAAMYEDHQFPIDLTNVAKDHTNLENDQLQSLYRRLCILNRCANMRLDQSHKPQTPQKEDSDDENCALSENWTFERNIRRWSRIGEMGLELPPPGQLNVDKTESSSKESSPDRFDDDSYDIGGAPLSLTLTLGAGGDATDPNSTCGHLDNSTDASGVRLRRTGSERFKDGAKAFLRRVESIKSRRRKRQNREGIVISGPQALELSHLSQRGSIRKPDAVYSTPPSPSAVSPMHSFPKTPLFGNELKVPSQSDNFLSPNRASPKRTPTTPRSMRTSPLHFFSSPMPHLKEGKVTDDSSSYYSDSQESSAGGKLAASSLRKTPSKTRRFLQRTGKVDDIGAHSDSECHQGRKLLIKDANSNTTEVKVKKLSRGGSLNLGKDPKKRDGFRSASFRSRSTTRKETKSDEADIVKKTPVMRWHSFQMEERPHMIFRKCFTQRVEQNAGHSDQGITFAAMSAGQLHMIRKLALVILTGHMERYCPSHRSGWNWELPKFIKKIKMPDYKDKKVFGVPLLLILQRSGQTLPVAVRAAFRWLQLNALDQIGLFRKSGVKSRIVKLKELIEGAENTAECMDVFDTQQAYDVADMTKQYFRDLPESLLTTKMSETFVAIFQHLPANVRLEAVQCAVLLLPDENREILFALLEFLTLVADNSQYNQMTANNLAVCLAPSLFHSSISTGAASVSASPRRRNKNAGVPDVKELSEAKASHECLSFMIENYRLIFTASKEKIAKCNFGYMEESKPVSLEALGEDMRVHNWRGYLFECTSATIKEGREKTRGWFTTSSLDNNVDIAYKKVGDGHPLRLWRCITEVEGPPKDVLEYIVKQRASWDPNLLQSQTIKRLDDRTEIFQYAIDGQVTTDFCVVRAWQTDLPRGACVIVETSIDHPKAKAMFGAVRGVVLASRYLIEPCGSGRSRVMHLARVDIKGKTPEWYNKSYGHICSHFLSRIRLAFKNVAEGPESKV